MCVKFQLSACNRFRDMTGSQIYPSVGCKFLAPVKYGGELRDMAR